MANGLLFVVAVLNLIAQLFVVDLISMALMAHSPQN